jgi:hypothetical protein
LWCPPRDGKLNPGGAEKLILKDAARAADRCVAAIVHLPNGVTMAAAEDGGLFRSSDNGETWRATTLYIAHGHGTYVRCVGRDGSYYVSLDGFSFSSGALHPMRRRESCRSHQSGIDQHARVVAGGCSESRDLCGDMGEWCVS